MADLADLANLDYVNRINRAIDHITRNLAQPLKLGEVARVAAFSPFHFHRIFRAMMGETVHDFVKRTRLDRALYLMSHDQRPLTEIALEVGFSSSSEFSRSFKARFGVSPRAFNLQDWRDTHAARIEPKIARAATGEAFKVRMRELPERRVAYLRVLRPFEKGRVATAAAKLVAWAKRRGLADGQWLGYMWEEPELVPLEMCRYDVGLEIPEGVQLDEEVCEQHFPAMTVAELEFKGTTQLEVHAFDWLYGTWLPRSGRAPAHQPVFEAWNGLPFEHGESHFDLCIQLAVTGRGPARGS